MSISAVTSLDHDSMVSAGRTRGAGELGKQEFLMLLVAQLRNQDPLNPMQDREFIAQLAQLNALEQMQQLNRTVAGMAELTVLSQVSAFLGKQAAGIERGSGELVEGIVTRVTVMDGNVVLDLGGKQVDVRDLVSIADPPAALVAVGARTPPAPNQSHGMPQESAPGTGVDSGEPGDGLLPGEPVE
jgi:flagellar basal-body rod modification protein FlgD